MRDYAGLAALVGAFMTPLTVVAVALLTNRSVRRVGVVGAEALRVVREVDRAVNGKSPRETTISEDVMTVKAKQERDLPSDGEVALLPLVKQLAAAVAQIQDRLDEKGKP